MKWSVYTCIDKHGEQSNHVTPFTGTGPVASENAPTTQDQETAGDYLAADMPYREYTDPFCGHVQDCAVNSTQQTKEASLTWLGRCSCSSDWNRKNRL